MWRAEMLPRTSCGGWNLTLASSLSILSKAARTDSSSPCPKTVTWSGNRLWMYRCAGMSETRTRIPQAQPSRSAVPIPSELEAEMSMSDALNRSPISLRAPRKTTFEAPDARLSHSWRSGPSPAKTNRPRRDNLEARKPVNTAPGFLRLLKAPVCTTTTASDGQPRRSRSAVTIPGSGAG